MVLAAVAILLHLPAVVFVWFIAWRGVRKAAHPLAARRLIPAGVVAGGLFAAGLAGVAAAGDAFAGLSAKRMAEIAVAMLALIGLGGGVATTLLALGLARRDRSFMHRLAAWLTGSGRPN